MVCTPLLRLLRLLRLPGTPGSQWSIPAHRSPWTERRLQVITTERPGFGRSTASI
jgi:hypothetical protein